MIQKVAIGRFSAISAAGQSARQALGDDPNAWNQWAGTKRYTLEVVQHPIRARMCGFGDKDRRPLAPAAVAKMIILNQDNSIVDIDDIDYTFFVATVDLWSADGKQEMNLVLHPSSSDRYHNNGTSSSAAHATSHSSKTRRRSTNTTSTISQRPTEESPVAEHPSSSFMTPGTSQGYNNSNNNTGELQYPTQPPSMQNSMSYQPEPSYASDSWGYAVQQQSQHQSPVMERTPSQSQYTALPPIHSFGRTAATASTSAAGPSTVNGGSHESSWPQEQPSLRHDASSGPGVNAYRQWPSATDPGSYSVDHTVPPPINTSAIAIDPSLRGGGSSSLPPPTSDIRGDTSSWPQTPVVAESFAAQPYTASSGHNLTANPQFDTAPVMYPSASAAYTQQQQQQQQHSQPHSQPQPQYHQGPYLQNSPPVPPAVPLPRHTYTRTLVGPLSANASRLLDEHKKPGIFFLFQDLSIRTEGTFRLRLRLMNIGAPSAPELGAHHVHQGVSPILAQTFTEPFTVFSAKRFPGVPDTTPLSIAFGNQGQKLPLRNRHGPSKGNRKRRRAGESEGSEDDSDA